MKKAICILICLFMLFIIAACGVTQQVEGQNTVTPSVSPSDTQLKDSTQTPIGMSPGPSNSASMYSSYAHMVSFDPARGWADFDYFEMLKGDDAVEWLVDNEGYTLADAEAEVEDFADSEFIEKNTNPQLRTIDLREIPLKLMYHSDGTMVEGADGIDADLEDLYNLYELNSSLVLDSFFYYVEVEDGEVVAVSQVYWP
ncbi:MAG: hypothetical protein R2876_04035 [Eubacteriales bacterium]